MPNTKRRKTTLLPLIEAQIAKLTAGISDELIRKSSELPMLRDAYAHIRGQILALEEVRAIILGERRGFSE